MDSCVWTKGTGRGEKEFWLWTGVLTLNVHPVLRCRSPKNAHNYNDFSGWVLLIQLCFALLKVELDLFKKRDIFPYPFTLFTSFLLRINPLIRHCHPSLNFYLLNWINSSWKYIFLKENIVNSFTVVILDIYLIRQTHRLQAVPCVFWVPNPQLFHVCQLLKQQAFILKIPVIPSYIISKISIH